MTCIVIVCRSVSQCRPLLPRALSGPQPLQRALPHLHPSSIVQVFTAVLMHYTRDQLPFTMFADSKVPNDIWGKNNGAPVWGPVLVGWCGSHV